MFLDFRLRFSPIKKAAELTGRLFSCRVRFQKAQTLAQWLGVGLLAFVLGLGTFSLYQPVAQAAVTSKAEAYGTGPIRQSHNPLSGENFHGGVDASALKQKENLQQPPKGNQGFFEAIKDKIVGDDDEAASVNLQTEKNPTLERYPESKR